MQVLPHKVSTVITTRTTTKESSPVMITTIMEITMMTTGVADHAMEVVELVHVEGELRLGELNKRHQEEPEEHKEEHFHRDEGAEREVGRT